MVTVDLFCIKVYGFKILKIGEKICFRIQKHFQNNEMGIFAEKVYSFLALTIFKKTHHPRSLTGFRVCHWHHYINILCCNFHSKYYSCFIFFALFNVNVSYKIHYNQFSLLKNPFLPGPGCLTYYCPFKPLWNLNFTGVKSQKH